MNHFTTIRLQEADIAARVRSAMERHLDVASRFQYVANGGGSPAFFARLEGEREESEAELHDALRDALGVDPQDLMLALCQ